MPAKEEKRRHPRYSSALEMDVTTPAGDIKTYITLDVSDGDIFVSAMADEQLPVGTEVTITPTQRTRENKRPTMRGRVAHQNHQSMGISFLDLSFIY